MASAEVLQEAKAAIGCTADTLSSLSASTAPSHAARAAESARAAGDACPPSSAAPPASQRSASLAEAELATARARAITLALCLRRASPEPNAL
jgi:hypothetical protein